MRPGSIFSEMQTRPAGHIFFIPGVERPGDDLKNRPHFLVNRCDPTADPHVLGTLAHMSTKATELTVYGCAGYVLQDRSQPRDHASYVITSRLVPQLAGLLKTSQFSCTDHVRSVRGSVLQAVGIGEGIAEPGDGSVRGRLARVVDHEAGFRFGVVLTSHGYSRQRRFQVVVPVVDRLVATAGGIEELEVTEWDVLPERKPWFDSLPLSVPLLETAAVISLTEEWKKSRNPLTWLGKQIELTDVTIDPATLAAVDAKITERLRRDA
ncbi:MAG TPA: hypothetical protein VF092_17860 [Longimicrobium sp.]